MSQVLFSALTATSPGRIDFDIVNDHLVWDAQSLAIFGLSRTEFIGTYRAWERRVHEEDLPRIQREVAHMLDCDKEVNLRYRIRRPNGEIRHVWALGIIERDTAGKAIAIRGLHLDETQVLGLEATARLQSELLNTIGEGVCVTRATDGIIVYANPGLLRMFKESTLVGQHVGRLLEKGQSYFERAIAPSLAESSSWLGEVRYTRPDGSAFWASTSVTGFGGVDSEPLVVWVIQDLDRPQHRDQAVVTAHAQLSTIYNAIADAVFSVRMPAREIEYGNRAVSEMFGYAPEEYIGNTTRLFYPDDAAYTAFGKELRQAFLAGQRQVRAEVELVTKAGKRFWTRIITTFVTQDGELAQVISVVRDISQQKELELQLMHALKLEAIGELAGGVAHDMNNILGAILSFSSVALEEMQPGAPWRADVARIVEAAERGRGLVQNLLGFARKGAYSVRVMTLDDEIARVLALLVHTLPKGIELELDLGAPGAQVKGDADQLTQTILNLCVNAQDALNGTGKLVVRTRRLGPDHNLPETLQRGDYYMVEVSDNGPGMSPEVEAKAFQPFFTTKELGKGSGLGLSMAYGVLHRHGGTIQIETKPGVGTRVQCWLPLVEASPKVAPRPRKCLEARRLSILVVDDEAMLRAGTKRALERLGHEVLLADSGNQAIHTFREHHARLDVVLLDLSMPDMDGIECSRHLREIDPEVRVVLATGHWDPETATEREREELMVMRKPFGIQALRDTLGSLERRRHRPNPTRATATTSKGA